MLRASAVSQGLHSVVGAFVSVSITERWDNESNAIGQVCVARVRSELKGVPKMGNFDRRMVGEKFSPTKNFSPVFPPTSEPEAAKEFSAVILDFSVGELAQATNRSKETAKCWKQGRAFPNGVSLMALMAEFPSINAWVEGKTGHSHSPQSLGMKFALLEQIMSSDSAEGRAMRARFQQIVVGEP